MSLWEWVSMKILYAKFGLGTKSVFFRTLLLSVFYALLGVVIFDVCINDIKYVAIVAATGWGIYKLLYDEFVSKYMRLATIHDRELEYVDLSVDLITGEFSKLNEYIGIVYLNFAEDCLSYHLERNIAFRFTFGAIMHGLCELKIIKQSAYDDLLIPYPEIRRYLEKNCSAINSKKDEKREIIRFLNVTTQKVENNSNGE